MSKVNYNKLKLNESQSIYPAGCESVTQLLNLLRVQPDWLMQMVNQVLEKKVKGNKAKMYCEAIWLFHNELQYKMEHVIDHSEGLYQVLQEDDGYCD